MLSGSTNSDIPIDRYGEFKVYETDDIGLMEYIIEYNEFSEYLKSLDLAYTLILMSDDEVKQFEIASSYLESYSDIQELMYLTNKNHKIPSEFEKLHESLIKEIGIADLITEEFSDAIKSGDFSKVDELEHKSSAYRKEGLASTDCIEYFEEAEEFILKN